MQLYYKQFVFSVALKLHVVAKGCSELYIQLDIPHAI